MNEDKSVKNPIAQREEEILNFWEENKIFEKTLEKEAPQGEFVFYEGPPTANGRPGIHHLEARAFKDAIPRYKTMQGFHVARKGGWDTHGLPVELEVEKQLGFKGKKDIEAYGIAEFNKKCKESVWKYVDEWKAFTKRMGYWVDLDHPYVTYDPKYMESIWAIVKKVYEKDLLYKDYRIVPWCPRCGTALSSHELAQGYADVKDLSVYVKFKIKGEVDTSILAWTTTPWTLPGNVALAVGKDIEYVKVQIENEYLWLAKDRLSAVSPDAKVIETTKGKDLIGLEYEPLYPYFNNLVSGKEKEKLSNAFKIYDADFVTTTDGTGIVHTAVMYGADDFVLGTKVGLPKFHLVSPDGTFISGMDFLSGRFVKPARPDDSGRSGGDDDVAIDIIKDLAAKNLLFKKEKIEHTYPFCWRCKTPLIYYARDSWYIAMSELRDTLVKENEGIHWEPEYIKEGRFGEWLREIKDWAISRERYWGTPLPVWVCEKCAATRVVGSIDDIKSEGDIKTKNTFVFARHGHAENLARGIANCTNDNPLPLTDEGRKRATHLGIELKNWGITSVYASPLLRTKETVELIAKEIGIPMDEVIFDDRLKEINFGVFNDKPIKDYLAQFPSLEARFNQKVEGGETIQDVKNRMGEFIYEINSKYKGEKILIVSHEGPIWTGYTAALGQSVEESVTLRTTSKEFIEPGTVKKVLFTSLPHNENYELDLHRPYIDAITLTCDCGGMMKRVQEVMDVWFDSGAMPFAQYAYTRNTNAEVPENAKKNIKPESFDELFNRVPYPADFISEAIDQTRGWFYTLHAIGNLLEKGKAYKNVICLGHILDKDGLKMSKSKGNTVNPWDGMDTYGADALRFWMYSINQPGESKNFDEKTVDDVIKKVFNLILNVVNFYELGLNGEKAPEASATSTNILDMWIVNIVHKLSYDVTKNLEDYKLLESTRAIREFIAEFSQWYIRRSRDRFKTSGDDRNQALATTRYVLKELSKLMAPFMPYVSEQIYQKMKANSDKESVHLENWPQKQNVDEKILTAMAETRRIVSLGLEARAKVNIKVRQILGKATTNFDQKEYFSLIKDELNVEEVLFDKNGGEIELDMIITPELKEKGAIRDEIRTTQEIRKEKGLKQGETLTLVIPADKKEFYSKHKEAIGKATNTIFTE